MNLISILSLLFISQMLSSESVENHCKSKHQNENYQSSISDEVFEEIRIQSAEDLMWNVLQLEITLKSKPGYGNSSASVFLSGEEECDHFSEYNFNLSAGIISIPETNHTVPVELRPCHDYTDEDIFDSFPNKIMKEVHIKAFKNNAVRLNISFLPQKEYLYHTGVIVLNSRIGKCNHPEQFQFSMTETNLTVPRANFPHSFIDSGCEYIIDFEVDNYCVTTTYEVPDLCSGNEPQTRILEINKENEGIYKVIWDPRIPNTNYSDHIIEITYRLENVTYDMFNTEMILENQYQYNYSLLNLSSLPKDKTYELFGIFVNDAECSNIALLEFSVFSEPKFNLNFLGLLPLSIIIFSVFLMFLPMVRRRINSTLKKLSQESSQTSDRRLNGHKQEEINPIYRGLELENCDDFEFPRSQLVFRKDENTREGFFGVVYIGKALDIKKTKGYTYVAIKTLKDNAPTEVFEALLEEINTMKKIRAHGNHLNVVNFLGCCTLDRPHLMILEYAACGDLHEYLVDLRKEWASRRQRGRFFFPNDGNGVYISPNTRTVSETSSTYAQPSPTETESTILYDDDESLSNRSPTTVPKVPALSNIQLQSFALQIAKGMAFLESIPIVHRDLAARNVLITEARILKISDFGMSRFGNYVCRKNCQQPIRWMALESLEECVSTSKSDVWSFGVVLWEIGTLGAFPYDDISNEYILHYLITNLRKGIRLMRPEICTDELYNLMLKCWSVNPDDRPSFQQIVEELSGEKRIYMELHKLNPAYDFPPMRSG
ncbi:hypothetical protein WA026_006943 [Henosepilachna vigintioctopunctata]|uniref:Protein kinase domain-containing protein n=1 Tax=Henosepilachna vigintioctopunctata TaxID=420089 RepID=A0AAW1V1H6_9CUCU